MATITAADKRCVREYLQNTNRTSAVKLDVDNGGLALSHDDILLDARSPEAMKTALEEADGRLRGWLGADGYHYSIAKYTLAVGGPGHPEGVDEQSIREGTAKSIEQGKEIYRAEIVLDRPLSASARETFEEIKYGKPTTDTTTPEWSRTTADGKPYTQRFGK